MRSAPKLWPTSQRPEVATCITSALNLPSSDLVTFCEMIKPDLVLLSLTEVKPEATVLQQLKELESLATSWAVAVGGQGARAIEDRLREYQDRTAR